MQSTMSQTPVSSSNSPAEGSSSAPSTPNDPAFSPLPATAAQAPTIKPPTGIISESEQEFSPAKGGNGHDNLASPLYFSYNLPSNASANSQQSSSGSAVMSNPLVSSGVPQNPLPSPTSSPRTTFSYISHSGAGSSSGQKFQHSMHIAPGSQKMDKDVTPLHGPFVRPNSFTLGADLRNSSITLAQDAGVLSHVPSVSPYAQVPHHDSTSFPNSALSTLNMGPPSTSVPASALPSFPVPWGMLGTPRTPGPPGVAKYGSQSSHFVLSSGAMESSAVMRPIPSNHLVPPQLYPTHPSLPTMASPAPFWLQSAPLSNLARPSFVPNPGVVPGSFSFTSHGMPIRSVSLPDSKPPGVTPLGNAISPNTSYVASEQQLSRSLETQQEVTPPGLDSNKNVNDIALKDGATINEPLDTWTAHKTDTGVIYYYNVFTRESTYKKPSGFKEPDKVTMQTTPVSWEKLEGTDWTLVSTNDGKKYYYNTRTKLSSWQIPMDVAESAKKQAGGAMNEHSLEVPTNVSSNENRSAPINLSAPAVNTGGRDSTALRSSTVTSSPSSLDLIKKKLQDSGLPITSSPVQASSGIATSELYGSKTMETTEKCVQSENSKDKLKDANEDGNISDSSSDSEDEERGPSKELCIIQFKEMLKERGVAPFSKWDKELPKIVFDPRFKAIPSHSARRSLFDHFVKTRAEEERKEKRAAQKAAIGGFKQLLEEASEDIDQNTDYHTFRKKWGNDPRFEIVERKERESLLNERVLPLKRAAEEKVQAKHEAAALNFKSMLQEKGDITTNTRWEKVKDNLRDDHRYKSVKYEDRELLFKEFIFGLKSKVEEAEQEAKAKRQEQDKLKERERELRKRKERDEEEMERVRFKVRRKEAISSYQALLVESMKDPQASWSEAKLKLEKDPQGRAANPELHSSDLESLFREHIKMLRERCASEFKTLLAEVITTEAAATENKDGKTVFNSWSTAKHLLKPDPRFTKMPRKESEALWRRYTEDIQHKHKLALDKKDGGKNNNSSDSALHHSRYRRTNERS